MITATDVRVLTGQRHVRKVIRQKLVIIMERHITVAAVEMIIIRQKKVWGVSIVAEWHMMKNVAARMRKQFAIQRFIRMKAVTIMSAHPAEKIPVEARPMDLSDIRIVAVRERFIRIAAMREV